jgi:hypothetical protein
MDAKLIMDRKSSLQDWKFLLCHVEEHDETENERLMGPDKGMHDALPCCSPERRDALREAVK